MDYRTQWKELRHNETEINGGFCPECAKSEQNCNCNPIFKVFEYDGITITNPYISECGRFTVNPFTYYGLTEQDQI